MTFGAVKAYVSRCESYAFVKLGMKSEESTFTHFNFSFVTFPRQVFVGIFDSL